MSLISITLILIIIGIVLIIIGEKANINKIKIIGSITICLVLVYWLGYSLLENVNKNQDATVKVEEIITNENNEVTVVTEEVSSNNIYDIEYISTEDAIDITSKFETGKFYQCGQIYKIENDLIYFITKDAAKYILKDSSFIKYIDGRTGENISDIKDIKEGSFVSLSINTTCEIYKDIHGEELKKELLISLSLPDEVNLVRAWTDEIKYVQDLGNGEAIITLKINDVLTHYSFPVSKTECFEMQFKLDNSTKYNSNVSWGPTKYPEAIEVAKSEAMLSIKVDLNTIEETYPVITEFDAHSN